MEVDGQAAAVSKVMSKSELVDLSPETPLGVRSASIWHQDKHWQKQIHLRVGRKQIQDKAIRMREGILWYSFLSPHYLNESFPAMSLYKEVASAMQAQAGWQASVLDLD